MYFNVNLQCPFCGNEKNNSLTIAISNSGAALGAFLCNDEHGCSKTHFFKKNKLENKNYSYEAKYDAEK